MPVVELESEGPGYIEGDEAEEETGTAYSKCEPFGFGLHCFDLMSSQVRNMYAPDVTQMMKMSDGLKFRFITNPPFRQSNRLCMPARTLPQLQRETFRFLWRQRIFRREGEL